jgi:protein SCO1
MAMLRTIRIVAWALIAALGGLVILATAGVRLPGVPQGNIAGQLPLASAIGGPFALPSTRSGTVSNESLKGKPFAVFFGFTFCPDVCPTTLLDLSNTIKQLGNDADRMNYLFVSVDPSRDTIEQLKLYLSSFDPHIIGATGTDAQIAEIARAYRAVYEKVPTKESYTMNHTATTYLMNAQGQFHGTLAYQENSDVVLKKLKRLIAGP